MSPMTGVVGNFNVISSEFVSREPVSIDACTTVPVGTSQPTKPLPKKLPEKLLP